MLTDLSRLTRAGVLAAAVVLSLGVAPLAPATAEPSPRAQVTTASFDDGEGSGDGLQAQAARKKRPPVTSTGSPMIVNPAEWPTVPQQERGWALLCDELPESEMGSLVSKPGNWLRPSRVSRGKMVGRFSLMANDCRRYGFDRTLVVVPLVKRALRGRSYPRQWTKGKAVTYPSDGSQANLNVPMRGGPTWPRCVSGARLKARVDISVSATSPRMVDPDGDGVRQTRRIEGFVGRVYSGSVRCAAG